MTRPARLALSIAAVAIFGVLAVGSAEPDDSSSSSYEPSSASSGSTSTASTSGNAKADLAGLTLEQARSKVTAAGWTADNCGDYDEEEYEYFDCELTKDTTYAEIDRTIWSDSSTAREEAEDPGARVAGYNGKASLVVEAYDIPAGETLAKAVNGAKIDRSKSGMKRVLKDAGLTNLSCDYDSYEGEHDVSCEGKAASGQSAWATLTWGTDAPEEASGPEYDDDGTWGITKPGMQIYVAVSDQAAAADIYAVLTKPDA